MHQVVTPVSAMPMTPNSGSACRDRCIMCTRECKQRETRIEKKKEEKKNVAGYSSTYFISTLDIYLFDIDSFLYTRVVAVKSNDAAAAASRFGVYFDWLFRSRKVVPYIHIISSSWFTLSIYLSIYFSLSPLFFFNLNFPSIFDWLIFIPNHLFTTIIPLDYLAMTFLFQLCVCVGMVF